ncbi:MAG TPA: hypothetical protein VKU02_26540 [Gemmataceae bacterium]|nr:hypothetical protein [Gemmataceae bacterium]
MMNKSSRTARCMTRNGIAATPRLRVRKGATRKEIAATARRAFTAADLQKFTEFEEGVPAEQVVAELETIYQETHGRKSKQ